MRTIIATAILVLAAMACAATLSDQDAALIGNAGVPIHPDAVYVYGTQEVGFRFATDKSVDEVRNWYEQQLGGWSLTTDFGLWAIYDGTEGMDFGERMSVNQVVVDTNEELPNWYSLDKDMTTEIVIQIVK